jgi:hypothetical protein
MSERRREQRQLTLKTAKIKSLDSRPDIDCAILDISAGGSSHFVARRRRPAGHLLSGNRP